jgi:hypothetical protein
MKRRRLIEQQLPVLSAASGLVDVRDAFLRKCHRANRWHLATVAMAERMQFLEGQPLIRR